MRKRLCMPLPPFSRALVISTQNVLNLSKIALVYAVKNLTRTQISDFLGFGQHWPLLQIVDQNIRLHNIIYTLAITNQVNVLSPCTGGGAFCQHKIHHFREYTKLYQKILLFQIHIFMNWFLLKTCYFWFVNVKKLKKNDYLTL